MQSTMTPAPAPVHAGNMPDPEVPERAKRRSFSAKEKLRILHETDKAPAGQIAAILRREGIYSSQLATWRQQRKDGSIAGFPRSAAPSPIRLYWLSLAYTTMPRCRT